jgi:shikimate dehydrogenase
MHPKACIIGDPVAHSRSPLIHEFWLKQLGLNGAYERAHVTPNELPQFIAAMKSNGYVGANCTIPHKETIIKLCDDVSPAAKTLGAVNTIWFENNQLYGDNSDVTGFLAALDHGTPNWDQCTEKAVVIGAGGAARAVIYGLLLRGITQIYVVNRSLERAQSLADQFGKNIFPTSFNALPLELKNTGLLINTTSLGMKGQPPLEIDLAPLPAKAIINDIVYVPLETELMKAAKARKLQTVGGLDMLLYQAVTGFEHWFGAKPVVSDELRQLIQNDIKG